MKFKKINEAYTSDDLYQELVEYIDDALNDAVTDIIAGLPIDFDKYDSDWARTDFDMETGRLQRAFAEKVAEDMLMNAPEVIED